MTELFDTLQEAKWRGVPFPTTRMRSSLAHDLAEHKYWGVDGARIEATGLAPMRHSFVIPMHDGIAPGKAETWKSGELYTVVFPKLLAAFALKASGLLQHPQFGLLTCKAEKMDIDWSGDRRGGCEVDLSFIETLLNDTTDTAERKSPLTAMSTAAVDLDASDADLREVAPEAPVYEETFDDMMRSIQAVFDQTSLLSQRAGGKIDSVLYRVNALADSVDRAKTAATWPVTQNIERIRAAAIDLRERLITDERKVLFYFVPRDTTLSGLARCLRGTTVSDLVKMNPKLVKGPIVPQYTVVRHYAPSVQ